MGPTDINIAQILHLSNFFELKRTVVYIHLQLRVLFYKYSSSKCKQILCLHYGLDMVFNYKLPIVRLYTVMHESIPGVTIPPPGHPRGFAR
jgi:hypothetical protein